MNFVKNYGEASRDNLVAVGVKAGFREPDCSPHPLNIVAIFALYQSVD